MTQEGTKPPCALDLQKVTLDYSDKNIPLPGKNLYIKTLITKAEAFVKNLRWRVFFFLHPENTPKGKETFGFPSQNSPPQVAELHEFENGLTNIIENIQFRQINNKFQHQMKKDLKKLKQSKKLIVPADKTSNLYAMDPSTYDNLLVKTIQTEYKKTDKKNVDEVKKTDIIIATSLGIGDRVKETNESQSFITLKDHKNNFREKPACCLINPCTP